MYSSDRGKASTSQLIKRKRRGAGTRRRSYLFWNSSSGPQDGKPGPYVSHGDENTAPIMGPAQVMPNRQTLELYCHGRSHTESTGLEHSPGEEGAVQDDHVAGLCIYCSQSRRNGVVVPMVGGRVVSRGPSREDNREGGSWPTDAASEAPSNAKQKNKACLLLSGLRLAGNAANCPARDAQQSRGWQLCHRHDFPQPLQSRQRISRLHRPDNHVNSWMGQA